MSFEISRRRLIQAGAALPLIGVGSGQAMASGPKKGGILRCGLANGSTTDSLDPATFENEFTNALTHTCSNYLTEVDTDGKLIPELAESWEASNAAKTWTINLRKGVQFHNGKEMMADDVIASLNHHRGEDSKSAAKVLVEPITEIKKVDDYTIKLELESANADFPFLISDYHLAIRPAKDGKIDPNDATSTGPYILKTFEPGVRAHFVRNPNYWKPNRAYFDEVKFLTIADAAARINALTTGEVDLIARPDLKTISLLKRRPGLDVVQTSGTQHYTLPMNTTIAPFNDSNVRLALKYAIDREEMVKKVLKGYGVVGNDHPIGRSQRYHNSDLPQRQYDADKAKFYLKKAGLEKLDIDIHMAEAAFTGAVDAGQLYSETAAAAGINMKVVREPNDGYWSNVWMKKPFCGCYWGGRPTEDWMFSTAYSADASWNDAYWKNEKFNQLLLSARGELDEDKRREMYYEMQRLVADDGGTVIPMFANYVWAKSNKLQSNEQMAANWTLDGQRFAERWWFS